MSHMSRLTQGLHGEVAVPGDKSISHRALMIGGLAVGETAIHGLLEAGDVHRTAMAMSALGASVKRRDGGEYRVAGRGVGGLAEPSSVLDMGNSGTGVRLLLGLAAGHPFTSFFSGDASLSARPMERVTAPLSRMGASFLGRSGGRLPLAVTGAPDPIPLVYELPVASAQVKSAVLLAGLNAPGATTVVEPRPTRDHTEIMLRKFGAEVVVEPLPEGGRAVTVTGQPELAASDITVPGDFSSAAFAIVASLIVPGSKLTLRRVGINPLRSGLLPTLREMGAEITVTTLNDGDGEALADLQVCASELRGTDVPPERAPAMIDEFPILAMAAACANGTTKLRGLGELRVKETDRLAAIARGLEACGVRVEQAGDDLTIRGKGRPPPGGAQIAVELDHRIAMAFLVLGMTTQEPVGIDDAAPIATSFPQFIEMMNGLGAKIERESAS